LATRTEPERDSWIERLHIAGFECLRIQLQSLREQLKSRTGHDPIEFGGLAVDGVGTAHSVSGKNVYHKHATLFSEFIIKYCVVLESPQCSAYFLQGQQKVVPYSIMSIAHGSDLGFLAASPQATLVINTVIGCC